MKIQGKAKTALKILKRPVFLGVILRDGLKIANRKISDEEHMAKAIRWICRAQDVTGSGGVSESWSVKTGWAEPYPETTGYLIPTMLFYAHKMSDFSCIDRAIQMGEFELSIQNKDGSFPSSYGTGSIPLVFDTGQVLSGLIALYHETHENKWLNAAVHAADWIISKQEQDGSWVKGSHKKIPHTYYTRVAWQLFEMSAFTGNDRYHKAAEWHIRWVLSQREDNDWINHMGFSFGVDPLTHTMAYTYEGLLESSHYVNPILKSTILATVTNAMQSVMKYSKPAGRNRRKIEALPAFVDSSWRLYGRFSCLAGNAQLACLWLQLFKLTKNTEFWDAAMNTLEQLKSVQVITKSDHDLHGGLAGAFPVWGGYGSLSLINWSCKFFVDALLLKTSIISNQKNQHQI